MRRMICLLALVVVPSAAVMAQSSTTEGVAGSLYFPPDDGHWERVAPAAGGWDEAKLDAALEVAGELSSSGMVILYQGRIMTERYWALDVTSEPYGNTLRGTNAAGRTVEDVASGQKSVVAVLAGIAQHRGLLELDDPVSQYLGRGWSKASATQESAITIRHLLTMTSGLTADLVFEADAGSTWFYNTRAYGRLKRIIAAVAGQDLNDLTRAWVTDRIGMKDTSWMPRRTGTNVGFASTARDLARLGLLILADGQWKDETIIEDHAYLDAALRPSQDLNPAYGYLWWLNGRAFWLRGPQTR